MPKTRNKESTRYYSNKQENSVCKAINATQQPNSGASRFRKGDCINKGASLLVECKTSVTDKESFSIKKDWILKTREEAFSQRVSNICLVFNFGPDQANYYVIDESLMKFLVEKLEEEYK